MTEIGEEISVLSPHGDVRRWVVAAAFRGSQWEISVSDELGTSWEASAEDLFDAFRAVRERPESIGVRFLVVGARVDCWPTRMSGQAGGAQVVVHYGSAVRMAMQNLISFAFPRRIYRYIFAPAAVSKVGTVAEQDAYRQEWVARRS